MRKPLPVVAGFLCGLIVGATGLAYAADNLAKVVVNGSVLDTQGMIIEGTTYLPVRAVANALNLDVAWDGATRTVTLTKKAPAVKDAVFTDKWIAVANVSTRKDSVGVWHLYAEVTNVHGTTISGLVDVVFYDSTGTILMKDSGAVMDLAPGATKTIEVLPFGLKSYDSYKFETSDFYEKR